MTRARMPRVVTRTRLAHGWCIYLRDDLHDVVVDSGYPTKRAAERVARKLRKCIREMRER